jgi:myo-inositol-1(or 4)-monophosphatase
MVALVDPLDGTENYTSGLPLWGISVSLWDQGSHTESALFFPELDLGLITGEKIQLHSSRIKGFPSSVSMEDLVRRNLIAKESRILGCASYNLYNVCIGAFKSFQNYTGAHSWDILAGLNLALEHGCEVIVDGEIYRGQFLPADRKYTFSVSR